MPLPLLLVWATEENLWMVPQVFRAFFNEADVNSGPPSEANSSGIPKVLKVRFNVAMRPVEPSGDLSTIGQLEYRSTMTKYMTPL